MKTEKINKTEEINNNREELQREKEDLKGRQDFVPETKGYVEEVVETEDENTGKYNAQEYKSNEQIPSNDVTPDNLKAPVEKNNDEKVLETNQKSQDGANKKSSLTENIRNYLGSDKLNEKLSTITKRYNEHKKKANNIFAKYHYGLIYE